MAAPASSHSPSAPPRCARTDSAPSAPSGLRAFRAFGAFRAFRAFGALGFRVQGLGFRAFRGGFWASGLSGLGLRRSLL